MWSSSATPRWRRRDSPSGIAITLTNNFGATTEVDADHHRHGRQAIDVLGWIGAALMPVDTLYQLKGVSSDDAAQASSAQIIIGARDRSLDAVNQLAAQVSAVVNPGGASSDDPGYYSGANGTIDTIHEYVTRRQSDASLLYYLLYALALVVGVVGALGLANALVTSVLERRREIGLLRAMGASGRRVAQVFWVESLSLGVLSWLIGARLVCRWPGRSSRPSPGRSCRWTFPSTRSPSRRRSSRFW